MRRLLSALAVLALLVAPARASETARHNVLSRMFTTNDWFGMPASSGDPFTCNAGAIRSMYYDTATDTVKFCNGSAWGSLGGITSPLSGDYVLTGKWTFGSAANAAGSVRMGETASSIVFEGPTADAFETTLDVTDPTVGDQTFHLPNLAAATSDTLVGLAATQTLTNKTLTSPTLTTPALGNATATTINNAAGTASLPAYYMGGDTTTGWYRDAANQWTFAVQTTPVLRFTTGGQVINLLNGSGSNPALAVGSAGTSGLYTVGSGTTLIASNGSGGLMVDSGDGYASVKSGNEIGWAAAADTALTSFPIAAQKGCTKTGISNSTDTTFLVVTAASGTTAGGTLSYRVSASDGTDHQTVAGLVGYTCANKAGTMTANVGTPSTTSTVATSGTLTVTFATTTGAGVCNVRINSLSSVITPSTITATWINDKLGNQLATCQ